MKEKIKKIIKFLGYILLFTLDILTIYFIFFYNKYDYVEPYKDLKNYPVFNGRNVYEFYGDSLSSKEKIIYEELKEGFLQFKDSFNTKAKSLNKTEIKNAFKAMYLDHPEIFWIKSYVYYFYKDDLVSEKDKITLKYTYDVEEAKELNNEIKDDYMSIVNEAKKYSSDYEKVKYVHDELIKIGDSVDEYSEEEKKDYQSIISIFVSGKSVCAGFTESFKLIMDYLGIKSFIVEDIVENNPSKSHVWNVVYYNDSWHSIDVTWDNSLSDDEISYKYFNADEDTFYKNHKYYDFIPS